MISALALTLCLALGMTTGSLASAADNEGAAYTTGVASVDQHMDAVARAKAKAAKAAKKAGKTKKDQADKTAPVSSQPAAAASTAAKPVAIGNVPRSVLMPKGRTTIPSASM